MKYLESFGSYLTNGYTFQHLILKAQADEAVIYHQLILPIICILKNLPHFLYQEYLLKMENLFSEQKIFSIYYVSDQINNSNFNI